MTKSKWTAVACLLALLAATGCSDDDAVLEDKLPIIEQQLIDVLPLISGFLQDINPFNPIARERSPLLGTGEGCIDLTEGNCTDSGTVEQCPVGADFEYNFDSCTTSVPLVLTIVVDGTLTYTASDAWPSGNPSIEIRGPQVGNFLYEPTLTGVAEITIVVTSLDTGFSATCDALLQTDPLDEDDVTCVEGTGTFRLYYNVNNSIPDFSNLR